MPDNSTVATQTLKAEPGKAVTLPAGDIATNAEFTRDGQDLCLTSDGHMVRIEGYFAQDPAPDVVTADGSARFTPELVDSFLPPQHPGEYAQAANTAVDLTGAVGKITKVEGEATIIRADGTKVKAELGAIVFQGDVITTGEKGAVNIIFADNTSFSISRNAKLAVDEFEYDPQEHSGTSFFSMLQGVFVYQSGDIGKDDPSKVNINTPVGSIGIRGTLVAGEINPPGQESKVTIVDGAVIITNGGGELVLNDAFETATLTGYGTTATNAGQLDSNTFSATYSAVAPVAANTFSAVASGVYQSTTGQSTPAQTNPVEGTQQPTGGDVKAMPDGTQVMPPTDGTVAPPPPAPAPVPGTQLSPDGSVLPPPPTDGTILPPPPAPAPQDGTLLQPLPGTQSLPGTQALAGTDGALPPPPTGSTFTDPSSTTFPTTSGSTFTGTTVLPPPPTGTVTTAPPPPPPAGTTGSTGTTTAPPAPMAQFVFAPVYLNGTPGDTSDDGIPIFGMGLNASAANPVMIGQLQLQNFATPPVVTITGANFNAGLGAFFGSTLAYANPAVLGDTTTNTLSTQPIMSFDNAGRLVITDPTGLLTNLNGPGYFNFTVNVQDSAGNVILNQSVFINIKQDSGGGGYNIRVGDHSITSANISDPAQTPRIDTITDTPGDDLMIAGDGNQASPLFGNIMSSTGGGNDVMVGGSGRDLMVSTLGTGFVKMFGLGGDDTMKIQNASMLTAPNTKVDGGDGFDTLVLGPLGFTGGLNFDLVSAGNTMFSVEKLMIEGGTTISNALSLDIRDVFEMTGANHRLVVGMAGGTLAEVRIVNSSPQNDLTMTASDATTVTYTGIHNSQTVTLIIETTNPGLTIAVT